jgi:hypothetical protein
MGVAPEDILESGLISPHVPLCQEKRRNTSLFWKIRAKPQHMSNCGDIMQRRIKQPT